MTETKTHQSIWGHEVSYVPIEVTEDEAAPYAVGTRVRTAPGSPGFEANGLPTGTEGTITGWGRDEEAHEYYMAHRDPEVLIDNEGPVVTFDNGVTHWFPGMSAGSLELVTS